MVSGKYRRPLAPVTSWREFKSGFLLARFSPTLGQPAQELPAEVVLTHLRGYLAHIVFGPFKLAL